MKKRKKKKKVARSNAWKNLEKTVASTLNGIRILRGADYSQSLPDVIVPDITDWDYSNSGIPIKNNTSIVVECKHSQTQPFVDLLEPLLDTPGSNVVEIEDFVFWNFEDTPKGSFIGLWNSLDMDGKITVVLKKIPQYIKDNYAQAVGYNTKMFPNLKKDIFRMVVIAKKNSPFRVAYTRRDALEELIQNL